MWSIRTGLSLALALGCSGGSIDGSKTDAAADAVDVDAAPSSCTHSLATGVLYSTLERPEPIALGDMDADGDLDVVTASGVVGMVSVIPNTGSGTLATAVNQTLGGAAGGIALGQVDADGNLDIMLSSKGGTGVALMRGNGNLTVDPSSTDTGGYPLADVIAANIDTDAFDEILAMTDCTQNAVVLFESENSMIKWTSDFFAAGANKCPQAFIRDLDGDTDLDLVMVSRQTGVVESELASGSLIGGGTRTDVANPSTFVPGNVEMLDLDTTGGPDLVATTNDGVLIARGQGDGHFTIGMAVSAGQALDQIVAADIDGDADLDIIALSLDGMRLATFRNEGDGKLTFLGLSPTNNPVAPYRIAAGDLNGDNLADVVVTYPFFNSIAVHLGACTPAQAR